ncbi:FAS1 domain-containing protein, partial [Parasitella parasitica]
MLYNIISILVGYLCLSLGVLDVQAQQALSSTAQNQHPVTPLLNAYELLTHLPETSKFSSLLDSETRVYLQNHTNITVFAPHNDAFHQTLLLNQNTTKYHILPQLCLDNCWNDGSLYKSTAYMKLWTNHNKNTKQIESGNMQSAAVISSIQVPSQQSVVHIIDSILVVPLDIETTLENLKFTKAKDMISQIHKHKNNSDNAIEMVTLFMPNNQAFGTVDPSTLGFDINDMIYNVHAIQGLHTSHDLKKPNSTMQNFAGSNITIHNNQVSIDNNTANIIIKDIIAENALIHSIDQILWTTTWVTSTNDSATAKKASDATTNIS